MQPASDIDRARPKVSVCMVTYNHEPFIAQAIDSVLMQETDFSVELVIGEDWSTDRTRSIVVDYQRRYPDVIRLGPQEKNLGAGPNTKQTLEMCDGEYIALLDGDDCWLSPRKLQKQIDELDRHPEAALCFHAVQILHADRPNQVTTAYPPGRREIYYLNDLAATNPIYTSSAVFRRRALSFPDWILQCPFGDWPLYVLAARHGHIRYIDEPMSKYRIHSGGVIYHLSKKGPEIGEAGLKILKLFVEKIDAEHNKPFVDAYYLAHYALAHAYVDAGAKEEAKRWLRKSWSACGYNTKISPAEPFRTIIHIYAPWFYRTIRNLSRWITRV